MILIKRGSIKITSYQFMKKMMVVKCLFNCKDLSVLDKVIFDVNPLDKLGNRYTPSPDGILSVLLGSLAAQSAQPLYISEKESSILGKNISTCKNAFIIPTNKNISKSVTGNYRPMSISSLPCRFLEKLTKDEISSCVTITTF